MASLVTGSKNMKLPKYKYIWELIKNDDKKILDIGTGGGLPGIPLAIYYNKKNFVLVDSIRKKISSVDKIIKKINAKNINTLNDRAENLNVKADIIICRSGSSIDNIIRWTKGLLNYKGRLILLIGGNVNKELKNIRSRFTIYNLDDIYSSLNSMIENNKFIELGKNAKEYASKFQWSKIIEKYKKILN